MTMKNSNKNFILACVLSATVVMVSPSLVFAQTASNDGGDLQLSGQTTFRAEQYGADGSQGQSPFTDLGNHYYQELNFLLNKKSSPYDSWQLEFGGLWNNSKYRSQYWGGEVERFRLFREKGDTRIPYRFEMGDLYANFSYRTLQRSLKGVQVEFQPKPDGSLAQSFILVLGQSDPDWKNLNVERDRTAGFSWLLQEKDRMKLAFNLAYNLRESNPDQGTFDRRQSVWGLAFERIGKMFGKKTIFETEGAWFTGDHDGTSGPASGVDRRDRGIYGQLSGGDRPFTYRLRYESYGQDFRPVGAAVQPDRKTSEGYFTWDLTKGRSAVLRLQHYRDGWETDNCLLTRLAGVSLRGPISARNRLHGGLDAFVQFQENDKGTTDNSVRSLIGDISKTFSDKLSGRLALSYRTLDSGLNALQDNRVSQLTLGIDHSVNLGCMPGRLSLDYDNRLIDAGGSRSNEWTPAIGLSLAKGPHDLGLHWRLAKQNQVDPTSVDVETADGGVRYRYHQGDHTFGVEYLRNRREDSTGLWTRTYQLVGFWTWDFDTVVHVNRRAPFAGQIASESSDGSLIRFLANLPIGGESRQAVESITARIGAGPRRWSGFDVWEGTFFEDVAQRQRLFCTSESGKLMKAAILVDVYTGVPGSVMDVFDRVKRSLIERFGTPADFYERGAVGPMLSEEVRSGSFVRTFEWRVPSGSLRLGIPRRLDGRLSIEVAIGDSFPPPKENTWGTENLD